MKTKIISISILLGFFVLVQSMPQMDIDKFLNRLDGDSSSDDTQDLPPELTNLISHKSSRKFAVKESNTDDDDSDYDYDQGGDDDDVDKIVKVMTNTIMKNIQSDDDDLVAMVMQEDEDKALAQWHFIRKIAKGIKKAWHSPIGRGIRKLIGKHLYHRAG